MEEPGSGEADRTGAVDDAAVVTRTFLIADVRGYTRYTQTHGDEEAGKLAATFAALARETVTAMGGTLLELRGDEALCVFHSARQALRASVELQTRFRARIDDEPVLPLGIGIGLAAGEAVPVEGGYRGAALNLAARLCGVAAPGQILASETVASLAGAFEGARFVERRGMRVKGLDKPVRAIEVIPTVDLPPLPGSPAASRRRVPLIAAGAVALAVTLAAGGFALTRGSDDPVVGNAVASIDGDGSVSYTESGTTPSTIAVGEGAVWVLNADDRTISKLDPETKEILRTFGTGAIPTDLAVGEGAVWVGNGAESDETLGSVHTASVSRFEPDSTVPSQTTALPGHGGGGKRIVGVSHLAAGAGALWAVNPDQTVSKLDAVTGKAVGKPIPVEAGGAIAAGREGVWVLGASGPEVIRINPRTSRPADRISVEADDLWGLAVGGGSVWATDLVTGILWRIYPSKEVPRPIDVGFGVTAVAYGAGAVWVTNFVTNEVVRVDPDTNTVADRIALAGTPPSVDADDERAWVSVVGDPTGEVLPRSACGPLIKGAGDPDVIIASDLSLQGPSAPVTGVAADAIRFLLKQRKFRAGRHTVGYQSCDDSTAQTGAWDYLKCATNAKAYAATERVVGVVGPWYSPCAWAQLPITNRADGPLAMIGPATTHPGLTHHGPGSDPDEPARYYPTGVRHFVRVTGASDVDGAAGAVLADELGLRRMFVLRSKDGIGPEATSSFTAAARNRGLTIVGSGKWDPGADNYEALAERVAKGRPDGVYLGDALGLNGAEVVKALRAQLGDKVTLIAGDPFQPPRALTAEAGEAAVGMYTTTTAVAYEGLSDAGRKFVRDFTRQHPGKSMPSTLYVYETVAAAEALLAAIEKSDGTRSSVTRELRRVQVKDGVLKDFGFDPNGDATPASFTVLRITGGNKRDPKLPEDFTGAQVDRVVRVKQTDFRP